MDILTYGLKRPDTGDTGFFDELEFNITQLDAHTHDGVTSALIGVTSISATTQAVSSAGWGSVSGGIYSQVVTMTSPLTYDQSSISFRDSSTKEILHLKCVKASSNTFTVYSNDNTLALSVVYR